jgi:hypothetical protein
LEPVSVVFRQSLCLLPCTQVATDQHRILQSEDDLQAIFRPFDSVQNDQNAVGASQPENEVTIFFRHKSQISR